MGRYRYSVRDLNGRFMKGDVIAQDRDEAIRLLQESGLYVTSVELATTPLQPLRRHRISAPDDQKIFLLESWSMYLEAGLSVQVALLRVRKAIRHRGMSRALQSIQGSIDQGMKLSEAVAVSHLFPPSWAAVFAAGERIGNFVGPLRDMRRQILQLRRLKAEIIRTMLIPAILGCRGSLIPIEPSKFSVTIALVTGL